MNGEFVVSIRRAQEANADVLARLSKEAFHSDSELDTCPGSGEPGGPPGYDSPGFQKFIMRIMNYYEIRADDELVGGLFFSSANKYHYVVERIFVTPSFHRRGIATKAMELAFEKHTAAKFWTLGTPGWNYRTQQFYERLGFVQVGWEEAEDPVWRGVWYQKTFRPYTLPEIRNLGEGMEFVTLEGTIAQIGSPRKVTQGKEARTVTVADAVLKDQSGKIGITVKGFQIPYLAPGTKVRVEYTHVSSHLGKLMLEVKYGRIINLI